MKRFLVGVLLLVLVAGLVATQAQQRQAINIGVIMELSGRLAFLGTDERDGILAARSLLPTVLGLPVTLSICDNQSTREGAAACADRFVSEQVVAVLGSCCSSNTFAAIPRLSQAGILLITPSATNPGITGDPWAFRTSFQDNDQGSAAASFVYEQGIRRIVVFIQQDDDYSVGLARAMMARFRQLGGSVTSEQRYTAGTSDFTAQLAAVRGQNPEAFYVPGFAAEVGPFLRQLRGQGFNQPVFGGDGLDDPSLAEIAGDALIGVRLTSFPTPELLPNTIQARDFRNYLVQQVGRANLIGYIYTGADAYNVLLHAIEQSAGRTGVARLRALLAGNAAERREARTAIRDALAEVENFPGVSGPITYKGTDGTPVDRVIGIFEYVRLEGGRIGLKVLRGVSTGG